MAGAQKLRWGILGPGGIAKAFQGGVAHSATGELVAIGTRTPTREGLSENFPGARIHAGYEALFADPEVDAVYISNLHPGHAEWAIKAAQAGKHVLVEKPAGVNAGQFETMIAAAKKAGTFLGEAFMYRCHPQTARLVDLVANGAVGEVRMIQSSFGFAATFSPSHRLFGHAMAGGGILDVGCYPVSMIRLLAGATLGRPFLDPVQVMGTAHLGQERTDEWSAAVLRFDTGLVGQASCAIAVALDNTLRVFGTKGRIEVKDFWFASGHKGGVGKINLSRGDATETIEVDEPRWLYSFEADAAAAAIRSGSQQFASPGMTWDDTLGNLRAMDKWREGAGLRYDFE
jgi:predicted dehydrogenase